MVRETESRAGGRCSVCDGAVEPWRDSPRCSGCARARSVVGSRRCSRCGELGHRVETCDQPPAGWLAVGAVATETLPVALSAEERAERAQELAEQRRAFAALKRRHRAIQRELARERAQQRARVDQLTEAAVRGVELRDVSVEARLVVEHRAVAIVRLDTGEVVRTRSLAPRELAQLEVAA